MSDGQSKKQSKLEEMLYHAAAAVTDLIDNVPGGRKLAQAAGAGVLLLYTAPAFAQEQ